MNLNELKLTPRRISLLQKMGIDTVEQLLKTFPYRYDVVSVVPFDKWQERDSICVEGLICKRAYVVRLAKNRSMTKFTILAWNEELEVTLFNRPWTQQFTVGKRISLFGQYQGNYKILAQNYNFVPLKEQEGMLPIYSLPDAFTQKEMRSIMKKALEHVSILTSFVPVRYQNHYRLLSYDRAIQWIHFPMNSMQLKQAIRTLKYEEFLIFQCVMQAMRYEQKEIVTKYPKQFDEQVVWDWLKRLPFELTKDQKICIETILKEMASPKIVFRLVQGDVGCGKTIIAMACCLACMEAGQQAAFLAPTEILARQHYDNLKQQGLSATLYVSSLSQKEKKQILEGLEEGNISLVVGTHALFQEQVHMKNLGFVVVDEQQRFGVKQRRALLEKGKNVDFVMMSATPIPRTYAHFIYGDMDISNIYSVPEGRKPIITKYIKTSSMKPVLSIVLDQIQEGAQCYVVCPAIEASENHAFRSAVEIYNGMKKTLDVRIGLLHGKMTGEEKDRVMQMFANHEIDILVSTTVIEVGIDVKNASVMVIYDAHRFGLSTLHQLRGRVGRGERQGMCFLLSPSKDSMAQERLKKFEELKDGFAIAQYDLQTRGPGDILGVRQSGLPGFVFGDMTKDKAMMEACVHDAREIIETNGDHYLLSYVKKAIESSEYFD